MKRRGENADRARPWLNWPARCGTRSIVRWAQCVGTNGEEDRARWALGDTRGNERREEALGWVAVGEHWRTGLAVTSRKTRGEVSARARLRRKSASLCSSSLQYTRGARNVRRNERRREEKKRNAKKKRETRRR